jgi:lipopolysaccharide export system protein LptA
MANFEAAALRGGSHFAHGRVVGRLFGVTKQHFLRLALHKMALRRRRETYVNRPSMRVLLPLFLLAAMQPALAQGEQKQPAPPASPPVSGSQIRAIGESYKSAANTPRRLNGPVTVTADRAEWQQAGLMRYTGHVQLSVDTIDLHGDSLELKQFENGMYEAHLNGEPSHFNDTGKDGAPPVSAEAQKIDYDARSAIVELTGGAVLMRGTDRLTGENIRYDVAARRVQAAGGSGGQVRIVIQPPPDKSSEGQKNQDAQKPAEPAGPAETPPR